MTIKHLVISGGGPVMVQILGAIQHLESKGFVHMNEIESVYGISAGALVGVLICLNFDWQTINDYIIKRPWKDVFSIKVQNILEAYAKKGIFDKKTIEKCLKPLFDAKDIHMNITLKEFFDLTNIELHMFSFEINEYKAHDISHLTHPNLELVTAVQMTCGLPVLMTPVCIDNYCFIDAGIICNYPLNYCIESGKLPDEILGFKNKYGNEKPNIINDESNLLDFILSFLYKAIFSINTDYNQPKIKHEVLCDVQYLTFDYMKNSLKSIEARRDLFQRGIQSAVYFLQTHEETYFEKPNNSDHANSNVDNYSTDPNEDNDILQNGI
jgi:hypothetical protein